MTAADWYHTTARRSTEVAWVEPTDCPDPTRQRKAGATLVSLWMRARGDLNDPVSRAELEAALEALGIKDYEAADRDAVERAERRRREAG